MAEMKRKNPHIGSSFEDFLDGEGILEECTNTAIKRVIARQVEQAHETARLHYDSINGLPIAA